MALSRLVAADCSTSGRQAAACLGARASRFLVSRPVTSNSIASRRLPCVLQQTTPGHRYSRSGSPVCLSAATVTSNSSRLGLSYYSWPERRAEVTSWLEACVEDVARHLDQAPFLELMYKRPELHFNRVEVPSSVATAPQLWQAIAEHTTASHPEVVLLVSRISAPTDSAHHCLSETARSTTQVLTGIATGSHQGFDPSWLSCEQLCNSRAAEEVCRGSFGDCCDEEATSSSGGSAHAHSHDHSEAQRQASHIVPYSQRKNVRYQGRVEDGQSTEFWGVVVQSKQRSGAEGCYILKTSRAADPNAECQCTHYSLMRMCEGQPLASQMASAWLP